MTRYVVVTNTTHSYLHIVMDLRSIKDFKDSEHASQVIPPGATAKFPIRLMSSEVKGLLQTVEYCINGHHFFNFEVTANVVPVSLVRGRALLPLRTTCCGRVLSLVCLLVTAFGAAACISFSLCAGALFLCDRVSAVTIDWFFGVSSVTLCQLARLPDARSPACLLQFLNFSRGSSTPSSAGHVRR